jgi:hypothetical protein
MPAHAEHNGGRRVLFLFPLKRANISAFGMYDRAAGRVSCDVCRVCLCGCVLGRKPEVGRPRSRQTRPQLQFLYFSARPCPLPRALAPRSDLEAAAGLVVPSPCHRHQYRAPLLFLFIWGGGGMSWGPAICAGCLRSTLQPTQVAIDALASLR